MTYPSEIFDIPSETKMQQCTLQRCQHIHAKLKRDLVALTPPAESRQSLEIVTHSLSELVDVYLKLGPTTDNFIEVMRKIKETTMGPDKWEVVKQRVTIEISKSMFNFKEGPKRKMLKVKYFKHPHIARYLYDRHIATYERLSWNDELSLYFEK